jgi:PPOX class probable F420-dependent enzyme
MDSARGIVLHERMATIPEQYRDLFTKKAFAHLATVGPDDAPQVTPVWVDFDGTHVRFNTAKGRVKVRNLARDPRVALSIQDPDNPYRYVQVRGRVVETTEKGADAHIDALAKKYLGQDKYPFRRPGEVRVMYKVLPESVQGM